MLKAEDDLLSYRASLEKPVIGMESEFNVLIDGEEIVPEEVWKHPSSFIDVPLLRRTSRSSQLPGGGAIYFDKGVIELVTPVIEIAPQCTSRMVRNLWEQVTFIREQLTNWGRANHHEVHLKGFSSHYNISFELPSSERSSDRNIQKLAVLLAYILPIPFMVAGANRRSTGVGVRPRRDRLEVTLDFTPDPGLSLATAALIVGIVRDIISWPSYRLSLLDQLPLPLPAGVNPGRHTTRKGWLTKDFHYPTSPYLCDIDAQIWETRDGQKASLREMALRIAWYFRDSIRELSDPFSEQLLFSVLRGETPSLLDLRDRPAAYDDIGGLAQWGKVIPELENFEALLQNTETGDATLEQHLASRLKERSRFEKSGEIPVTLKAGKDSEGLSERESRAAARQRLPRYRRSSDLQLLAPPWESAEADRRNDIESMSGDERRRGDDRRKQPPVAYLAEELSRSEYEQVFLMIASGRKLRAGDEILTPVGMNGWYHAIFQRESDGQERSLSIDQLLEKKADWI